MTPRSPALSLSVALAAAALLLAGCGDGRAGELACQQRLVDLAYGGDQPVARDPNPLSASFEAIGDGFDRMPVEGCTDSQRGQAARIGQVAHDLARRTARLGELRRAMERDPALRADPDFQELMSRLEGFEGRRRALRKDLARMSKAR